MALMTGLGSAGLGLLPLLLPVRRGRLGGGARGLLGPLQTQHQLDQLVLAQTLKFAAPHPVLESAKTPSLKGWVITQVENLKLNGLGIDPLPLSNKVPEPKLDGLGIGRLEGVSRDLLRHGIVVEDVTDSTLPLFGSMQFDVVLTQVILQDDITPFATTRV